MTITVYRVSTGPGDSFNEFPSETAANEYRASQGIDAPAVPVEKVITPPEP